jgi:hypothetical protein
LIADLFQTGSDELAIKASTGASLLTYIAKIDGIKDVSDAFRVAFRQKALGFSQSSFMNPISNEPDFEVCYSIITIRILPK